MSFDIIVNAIVMVADFGYIFLVATCVKLFQCNNQPGGHSTLNDYPALECYSESWYSLLPASIAGMILYGLGIPVWFGWVLYKIPTRFMDRSFRKKFSSLVVRF